MWQRGPSTATKQTNKQTNKQKPSQSPSIIVQSLSRVQLCNPMDGSTPGFSVLHRLLETTPPWDAFIPGLYPHFGGKTAGGPGHGPWPWASLGSPQLFPVSVSDSTGDAPLAGWLWELYELILERTSELCLEYDEHLIDVTCGRFVLGFSVSFSSSFSSSPKVTQLGLFTFFPLCFVSHDSSELHPA